MNQVRLQTALGLLLLGAALPVRAGTPASERPRYRLIDLGTFGGPASYLEQSEGILNDGGTAVGWANTSSPDPFFPFCDPPLYCTQMFSTHAFQVRNGKLTDLGTLPGGASSQAFWISANGLIAGFSDNGKLDPGVAGAPQVRPVLWRNGQIVDLGTLGDLGLQGEANAVNERGQVVGFALNDVPDPFSFIGFPTQVRPFLWQDGVMQDLGTLGGPDAVANFINDRGEVVGSSFTAIDPATGAPAAVHPFLWENGKMHDLGSLGGSDSEATGFNQKGDVIGNSFLTGDSVLHPFLWSRGHLKDLGTLGGDNGHANWINDCGEIAGNVELSGPKPQNHHAVLWRRGEMIDLGALPGDACSNAYTVNSRGQTVGTSSSRDLCTRGSGEHAFIWQNGGPMIDLNTVIPPHPNLQLTYAVAINDRGEIAGFGVPPGCAPEDHGKCGHAYVLIPCEEEENCKNVTLGGSSSVLFDQPMGQTTEPSATKASTVLDKARIRIQQRVHLVGHGTVPSD